MEEKKHYVLEIQSMTQENTETIKNKNKLEEALIELDEKIQQFDKGEKLNG